MAKLLIDWKLNKECNFNCSYCFKKDEILENKNPSKEEINNAMMVLDSVSEVDTFDILFSGGEPTLYDNLIYFINKASNVLQNKLRRTTIISNCSRNEKYFSELINNITNKEKVMFYYSVHSEYYNEEHTEKIIKLLSDKIQLYVAIMYNPEQRSTSNKIIKDIMRYKNDKFTSKVILLRKAPEFYFLDDRYNQNDFEFVNEINKQWHSDYNEFFDEKQEDHNILIQNRNLNYKNLYCVQGMNVLRINDDGFCTGSICPNAKKSHFSIYRGISPYVFDFPSVVRCKLDHCRL